MHRPVVMGTKAMVSSGHPQATLAGIEILRRGGNAIDAGVAMGLCINVTQPEMTNIGGVAPIIIYLEEADRTITISGVGTFPTAASIELLQERGRRFTETDEWADEFLTSVVPSALDAWITALDQFGTMTFAEVSKRAIELAENGFPAYPSFINNLVREERCRKWKYWESIFFRSGVLPRVGDLIIQKDLARTLRRLVKTEEEASRLGHHSALMAVRDEFYKGDIAKELIGYLQDNGGIMTLDDMAGFRVGLEEPVKTTYRGIEVCCCGPWSQGPVNLMVLNMLEGYDLGAIEHNSADYIHLMASALDLAFADRYQYIGDPKFVDVPIKELTSKRYAETRRRLIEKNRAWGKMPSPGNPRKMSEVNSKSWKGPSTGTVSGPSQDTSFGCVIDGDGNAFATAPSDSGRLVPGLGIVISPRGRQAWLDPSLLNSVEPGKRPRLTPNPALAFKDGKVFMAFGTPGGDSQPQTMVQVLVNIVDFNMNVQEAIEAPRFRSTNFPDSFWPHNYSPGRLNLEARIRKKVRKELKEMGYDVNVYPEWTWNCGGACAILVDGEHGIRMGGADPRRECYAIGY
ncbi:gamma-glutamyltransferase family protein [Candidatus Bathyarchaeota archaeon]|nr:gamma-glutamyltransferase family protein [Candidatus Bathyarchaeota archaeon]